MMLSLALSTGITLLLILEGSSIAYLLLRIAHPLLVLSLGLPIAALVNVLLVFLWTVTGIALSPLTLLGSHAIIVALLFVQGKKVIPVFPATEKPHAPRSMKILEILCIALIAVTAIYSFAHAFLLPTFQYDSATNWTMRSEISFYDRAIAFDSTEIRGMAKPQYPFLFHALQITANQGQSGLGLGVAPQGVAGWNDTAANAILWLLSLSSFTALFLILRLQLSRSHALLTLTMILGIPLLSLHLAQGYGDILLLQKLLLALACLLAWQQAKERMWLLLSGLFVAAGVWTKSEGLFFGLLPWLLVIGGCILIDRAQRKSVLLAGAVTIALSIPWPLFALSRGLLLTPHSGDTRIAFHSEGLHEAITGLFDRGSFGIAWYVLAIAVPWMIFEILRRKKVTAELLFLCWGIAVFLGFSFVYLFTPNVRFLLNAESYYRQMMIPAGMLLLSTCVWFGHREPSPKKS